MADDDPQRLGAVGFQAAGRCAGLVAQFDCIFFDLSCGFRRDQHAAMQGAADRGMGNAGLLGYIFNRDQHL